jgi:hypothetical protein
MTTKANRLPKEMSAADSRDVSRFGEGKNMILSFAHLTFDPPALPAPNHYDPFADDYSLVVAHEANAIMTLVALVSSEQNMNEEVICALIAQRFRVPAIEQLQRRQYDEVVRYLIDLDIRELLN